MASITIRNLDDDIKHRLRVRTAEHGRSMEEEARDILRRLMGEIAPPRNLAAAIRAREPMRKTPQFGRGRGRSSSVAMGRATAMGRGG